MLVKFLQFDTHIFTTDKRHVEVQNDEANRLKNFLGLIISYITGHLVKNLLDVAKTFVTVLKLVESVL